MKHTLIGAGGVVQWYCAKFQSRDILLIWLEVRHVPTALAAGAGGLFGLFFLCYHSSFLSRPDINTETLSKNR